MAEKTIDNPKDANATAPARAGSGRSMYVVVGLIALSLGAGVPYALQTFQTTARDSHVKAATAAAYDLHADDHPAFIQFGDIVVNLDETRLNRYLRLNMTLQVHADEHDDISKIVEERKATLKSWLLSYLSDRTLEEIRGASGQNRLRREIMDQFYTLLFPDGHDRIHDVLFEEFNIQ